MSLPTDSDARNALPIWDGLIAYFPDVWAEIAKVSIEGAKQHHLPKLGWDTHVSTDHRNKVLRHMLDDAAGSVIDQDGCYHLAKAVWRLCAQLQLRCWERAGKDEHGAPTPTTLIKSLDELLKKEPDEPIQVLPDGRCLNPAHAFNTQCCLCGAYGGAHAAGCSVPFTQQNSLPKDVIRCGQQAGKDEHGQLRPIDAPSKPPGVPDHIQDWDGGRVKVRMPGVVIRCPSCGAFDGAHFGDCDGETRRSGSEEAPL